MSLVIKINFVIHRQRQKLNKTIENFNLDILENIYMILNILAIQNHILKIFIKLNYETLKLKGLK